MDGLRSQSGDPSQEMFRVNKSPHSKGGVTQERLADLPGITSLKAGHYKNRDNPRRQAEAYATGGRPKQKRIHRSKSVRWGRVTHRVQKENGSRNNKRRRPQEGFLTPRTAFPSLLRASGMTGWRRLRGNWIITRMFRKTKNKQLEKGNYWVGRGAGGARRSGGGELVTPVLGYYGGGGGEIEKIEVRGPERGADSRACKMLVRRARRLGAHEDTFGGSHSEHWNSN